MPTQANKVDLTQTSQIRPTNVAGLAILNLVIKPQKGLIPFLHNQMTSDNFCIKFYETILIKFSQIIILLSLG